MEDIYNSIYNKLISNNINILIEAFVKYYGEEYRNKIAISINSIIFTWFRQKYLDEFYNNYKNYLHNGGDIKYFLKYDINEVIGATKNISDYKDKIKNTLNNSEYNFASNTTFFNDKNIIEIINLPIFMSTDRVLLHEVNHVIVCNNLFYVEEDNEEYLVRKDGLEVDTKYNIFEEIINELSSIEITAMFHALKGSIFGSKFKVCNDYEKLFPLVEPFYIKYKDILKRVRISLNYNELFKYIDKNVYDEYAKFINKVFYIKREYDKNKKKFVITKKVIDISNNYINDMDKGEIKKLKLV